jgi:hypothetical protein
MVLSFMIGGLLVGGGAFAYERYIISKADCPKVQQMARSLLDYSNALQKKVADDQSHINASNWIAGSGGLFDNVRQTWILQYQTDSKSMDTTEQGLQDLILKYPECIGTAK